MVNYFTTKQRLMYFFHNKKTSQLEGVPPAKHKRLPSCYPLQAAARPLQQAFRSYQSRDIFVLTNNL